MGEKKAPKLGGHRGAGREHFSRSKANKQDISTEEAFEKLFEETLAKTSAPDFTWANEIDWSAMLDSSGRARAFSALGYPETLDPDWAPKLEEAGVVGAAILHNRCRYWDTGKLKKSHIHDLGYWPGKKSLAQVQQLFESVGFIRVQPVINIQGLCRYFLHLDIDPDKFPQDRGKARYDISEVLIFNGFDFESYVKATQSDISRVLPELYGLIRAENITAWATFVDWVYVAHPEYAFYMANPHVCRLLGDYVKSRYALKCKRTGETEQKKEYEQREALLQLLLEEREKNNG